MNFLASRTNAGSANLLAMSTALNVADHVWSETRHSESLLNSSVSIPQRVVPEARQRSAIPEAQ
jgi:hypothetical protein